MDTYKAELLRARSRGTYWFLGLCLALFLFGMLNAKPQHHVPLYGYRTAAIIVATLMMGRAVTVAAGDFSSGTIRAWLISSPRRGSVCLGKLAASVTVAILFSLAGGVLAFLASAALGTTPTASAVGAVTGEFLLACVGFTIFGHGVAVLVRNIPVALCVTMGWVLAAEHLIASDKGTLWLPGLAAQKITKGEIASSDYGAAIAHVFVPFVIVEILAVVLFVRRDVNN